MGTATEAPGMVRGALDAPPFLGKAANIQAWGLPRRSWKLDLLQTESHDCPSSKKVWEGKLMTFQLLQWKNVDFLEQSGQN